MRRRRRQPGTATPSTTEPAPSGLVAQVASYDLVAGRDQRVIVGLQSDKAAKLVSFGTVELAFGYLGTSEAPEDPAVAGPVVTARFMPVPGQRVTAGEARGSSTRPRASASTAPRTSASTEPARGR